MKLREKIKTEIKPCLKVSGKTAQIFFTHEHCIDRPGGAMWVLLGTGYCYSFYCTSALIHLSELLVPEKQEVAACRVALVCAITIKCVFLLCLPDTFHTSQACGDGLPLLLPHSLGSGFHSGGPFSS